MATRSRTGLFLSYRHSARPIFDHRLDLDLAPSWAAIADRVNDSLLHTQQKSINLILSPFPLLP